MFPQFGWRRENWPRFDYYYVLEDTFRAFGLAANMPNVRLYIRICGPAHDPERALAGCANLQI
jgi:hypothetical protein